MTFFERFEVDILSGKKTITIRDESAKDYRPNSVVNVSTYESGRWFCELKIKAVEPTSFSDISGFHAVQENMTLSELKSVLREIYPDVDDLYVISYELVS